MEHFNQKGAAFEYCTKTTGDPDSYHFGWKDELHFYLDDYLEDDEHELRFVGVIYKDQVMLGNFNVSTVEECLVKFEEYLSKNK